MRYKNIVEGRFISRPNRFVANVTVDGRTEVCHVKNTGRCRELLTEGAQVWLEKAEPSAQRKTMYDLVAVRKGDRLINMDSAAPNAAAGEFLPTVFPDGNIRSEFTYGNSRFDFYIESDNRKILLEVKGVTLEEDGIVMFPDAPTERGVKHINELSRCLDEGFETYLLFVIQMKDVRYFTPNDTTHPEFGQALRRAAERGVKLMTYDCNVTPDSIKIRNKVEIKL
ncbi:MAG: DNA/RNA nuclease SfsA [Oscillospiraceae bacterium]|nr:DNA/RNA nuclease SfsA [Oscillospiraceae bacterium]